MSRHNKNPHASNEDAAWYSKFVKKPAGKDKSESRRSPADTSSADTARTVQKNRTYTKRSTDYPQRNPPDNTTIHTSYPQHAAQRSADPCKVTACSELFDDNAVPADAKEVLEHFDDIVQSAVGLTSRHIARLSAQIRSLCHELTDQRPDRRVGYLNDTQYLTAYTYYYVWWNLVRLVKLFANLPAGSIITEQGTVCADIGSGPLTVPIALWLARPELRNRSLVWYCVDISASALSLGENLFLAVAARTLASGTDAAGTSGAEPWRIIRVKGELGVPLKQKASLITCANMFNELLQHQSMPPEFLAKKYAGAIMSYADVSSTFFIGEPGVPQAARFISLLRDALMKSGCTPSAPCPHADACPMAGRTFKNRNAKWCNLAFSTDDAPARLLKLSASAGIPKERAVLSFILASSGSGQDTGSADSVTLRIISDPIRLPGNRTGFYACSALGLTLVVAQHHRNVRSGSSITIAMPDTKKLGTDPKTGAVEIII